MRCSGRGRSITEQRKYIDAVVGPQSYHEINKIILDLENKTRKINSTDFETIAKFDYLNLTKNTNSKTSSFLTIQEGVINSVSFVLYHILGARMFSTFH